MMRQFGINRIKTGARSALSHVPELVPESQRVRLLCSFRGCFLPHGGCPSSLIPRPPPEDNAAASSSRASSRVNSTTAEKTKVR